METMERTQHQSTNRWKYIRSMLSRWDIDMHTCGTIHKILVAILKILSKEKQSINLR